MNKTEKIRQIYSIVIGAFVVAIGVALICVAADIYYSNSDTGVIFTREIVAERLRAFIAPFVILIVAIAAGVIFPLTEAHAKFTGENTARLLASKLPSGGDGEEYYQALNRYNKLLKLRLILWCVVGAILLGCSIATLCYMLNTAHFLSENITSEIFGMVQNVLPWIAAAFAVLIVATILNGVVARQCVKEIKTLIKCGNGETVIPSANGIVAKAKKIVSDNITLWVVRGIILVVGVTFVIMGILNGGANDVLIKAINICTECIGLG